MTIQVNEGYPELGEKYFVLTGSQSSETIGEFRNNLKELIENEKIKHIMIGICDLEGNEEIWGYQILKGDLENFRSAFYFLQENFKMTPKKYITLK